jgi:copper(I)-binding protein
MGLRAFSRIFAGILAIIPGMLAAGPAVAAGNKGISVDGVWCRASEYRAHTAFVYLTLTVRGEPTDTLIGASTPLATNTEMIAPVMHKHRERLDRVDGIELDAHVPTVLQPQGPHFLLTGLHHKLLPGQSFVMTLAFAQTGKREITVHVLKSAPADGMPELPKGVKLD